MLVRASDLIFVWSPRLRIEPYFLVRRVQSLRRSYTYRPFWTKLRKKMINIIIIKKLKYIVNVTYFE